MPFICHLFPIFFFNDPATTEIYTLSLHDALPICWAGEGSRPARRDTACACQRRRAEPDGVPGMTGEDRSILLVDDHAEQDRKSTRLNSSHPSISYAVFCLKKKKKNQKNKHTWSNI